MTGDTPDISEWLDFDLYDHVWFWDVPGKEENPKPGQWLGVSHRIGGTLCHWVVDSRGHIFSRAMVQHVTAQDLKSDDIRQQFEKFDCSLGERLNDENFTTLADGIPHMLHEEDLEGNYPDVPNPYDPSATSGDVEEDSNIFDKYLGAELIFDIGPDGSPRKGTVTKHLKGEDGQPIGHGHSNPYLDIRRYQVDLDGIPHGFAANAITENIFSQVDSEGRQQLILREITDHRKNDKVAISSEHGTRWPTMTNNHNKRLGAQGAMG